MNKIFFPLAIFSSVFLCACNKGVTYTYVSNDDSEVIFVDNELDDKFFLNYSHKDFDGESIELEFKGNFKKDSVDVAVKRYLNTGIIPLKTDLN
jgi:hypothetical protein